MKTRRQRADWLSVLHCQMYITFLHVYYTAICTCILHLNHNLYELGKLVQCSVVYIVTIRYLYIDFVKEDAGFFLHGPYWSSVRGSKLSALQYIPTCVKFHIRLYQEIHVQFVTHQLSRVPIRSLKYVAPFFFNEEKSLKYAFFADLRRIARNISFYFFQYT